MGKKKLTLKEQKVILSNSVNISVIVCIIFGLLFFSFMEFDSEDFIDNEAVLKNIKIIVPIYIIFIIIVSELLYTMSYLDTKMDINPVTTKILSFIMSACCLALSPVIVRVIISVIEFLFGLISKYFVKSLTIVGIISLVVLLFWGWAKLNKYLTEKYLPK